MQSVAFVPIMAVQTTGPLSLEQSFMDAAAMAGLGGKPPFVPWPASARCRHPEFLNQSSLNVAPNSPSSMRAKSYLG
jgi:hypothetical protein